MSVLCFLSCALFNCLDQQRSWLLRQVEIDTHFLRQLNVLDYSLLLAHQPLHHDERHQGLSFATLIVRAKKYVLVPWFSFLLHLESSDSVLILGGFQQF